MIKYEIRVKRREKITVELRVKVHKKTASFSVSAENMSSFTDTLDDELYSYLDETFGKKTRKKIMNKIFKDFEY